MVKCKNKTNKYGGVVKKIIATIMLLLIVSCTPKKDLLENRAYWVKYQDEYIGWFDTEFHDYKYEDDNFCYNYDTRYPERYHCYPLKELELILIEEGQEPY